MIRVRVAAVAVAAGLLAIACGGAEWDDAANPVRSDAALSADVPTTTPTASAAPSKPSTIPVALKFTATTLNGEKFEGERLAGKPVVFWFWAPWCPKCRSEAPAVKAAAVKYKDVAFVGVASLDTEAAMKEFVQRTGTGTIVQLSDEKGAVWTKLGVSQQSTFVFMKLDGSTEKASGPLGSDELTGHVEKLLAG